MAVRMQTKTMVEQLNLTIGGIPFALHLPAPHLHPLFQARYRSFLSNDPARWSITLTYDPTLSIEARPWIRHEGLRTHFEIAGHTGWIDLAQRVATVSTPSDEWAHSALERVMAFVCMQELPRHHDALLLHGAGIVIDGRGYVFFGASGRGKSTVCRLARGRGTVLTDENVIIHLTAEGAMLSSSPFWGFGTPASEIQQVPYQQVPLEALYGLRHAPDFSLTRLSASEAALALLSSEKVATERTSSAEAWLAVVERLIERVPIYQLGFRPTEALWPFLGL